MRRLIPSPAMIVALIALVMAMGGSAYAMIKIGNKNLKTGAVNSRVIKDGSIQGKDIKNGAITNTQINGAGLAASTANFATAAGKAGTVYETVQSGNLNLPTTGSGQATVLTRNVPAGTYLIIGTGTLNNNSDNTDRRTCQTTAGSDSSDQLVGTDVNSGNDDTTPWTNTLVHTFSGPGTITLSCDSGVDAFDVEDARLEALTVNAITSQSG